MCERVSACLCLFFQYVGRKDLGYCYFLSMDNTHQQFSIVTEHFGIMCTRADLVCVCVCV